MFRWAILGAGPASRKFVAGLRQADGAVATVVASRRRENAQRLADELAVPRAAGSYDEAISLDDVDAFYVATPPRLHAPLALSCIEAGKPVLIEKPFAADAAAAEAIMDAAASHSVFCMEAMWTRFLPLVRYLKQTVHDGAIGEVRMISGSFGAPATPDLAPNLFSQQLGGGALLHRGVYPLSLASHLLGPPQEIVSRATIGTTGVDEDSVVLARHLNGSLSVAASSLRAAAPNDLVVTGTRATIRVHPPIYRPSRLSLSTAATPRQGAPSRPPLELFLEGPVAQGAKQRLGPLVALVRGRRKQTKSLLFRGNGYHYEADEVRRCVREGALESPVMPLAESLEIVKAMEEATMQWASLPR